MRKNPFLVRFLALILVLLLCGCGTVTPTLPDSPKQEPAQSQMEVATPQEEMPVERPVTEFTIAGFDKEGPGDFGYQTVLTAQEETDLTELLDMGNWERVEDPPQRGFTCHLAMANSDMSKYLWVMDGEDFGTFIRIDKQDGSSVLYTAPTEVHQAAKRFAQRLRMRDDTVPNMNPAQQELFDTYLFPWALQTPFDQSWDDPLQAAENMVFYLLLGGCCQLEYGSMEPMNQYETDGNGMPAEFVEQTLLAHFDLPLEWIRNHKEYDSEANVYHFVSGYGGVGNVGAITGSRQNGDLLEINCSWFDWRDGEAPDLLTYSHTVTIKLEEDGGWKYVGNQITWRLSDQD